MNNGKRTALVTGAAVGIGKATYINGQNVQIDGCRKKL